MATEQSYRLLSTWIVVVLSWIAVSANASEIVPSEPEKIIRVGPDREVKTLSAASKLLKERGTIEVDAGEYRADVAVWKQKNLTLRAVGGRVKLIASGAAAEGKGIWVIRGGKIEVDGFDFLDASVRDRNGAGIRLDRGHLVVRNSTFTNNENGILTGSDKESILEIENCEFGNNGFGDGRSHNLYVGAIKRLLVTGSYFHHARVGHLLKSRAAENHIFYNRLTDEIGGRASYELEFPNGGIAYVVGNVIQQGSLTENPHIISYAAEGYKWTDNELYLINNTLVDNRPSNGIFLRIKAGNATVRAINNLLVGQGNLETAAPGEYKNNINIEWNEFAFAQREDYRLRGTSKLIGKGVNPGTANRIDLRPKKEYRHPRGTALISGRTLSPGAMQTVDQANSR